MEHDQAANRERKPQEVAQRTSDVPCDGTSVARRPWTPPTIRRYGTVTARTGHVSVKPGDGLSNLT
ncbi:MAG TPA: hypothetical protein VKT77_15945 [Chthonomonadaceae bacterium]|nr:hypothetical protein [Chthonomonadaceae bacterium]